MNSACQQQAQRATEIPPPMELWIKRILRDRYGRVAREPIPEELLRLLDNGPAEA